MIDNWGAVGALGPSEIMIFEFVFLIGLDPRKYPAPNMPLLPGPRKYPAGLQYIYLFDVVSIPPGSLSQEIPNKHPLFNQVSIETLVNQSRLQPDLVSRPNSFVLSDIGPDIQKKMH